MGAPYGLTYDSAHTRLFVADANNNRVLVYNVATITNGQNAVNVLGQANFTTSTIAITQSGMRQPGDVEYDSTNSRLFVADYFRVLVFNVATITNGQNAVNVLGQANFTSSITAVTQSGMSGPAGLVYDNTNSQLYVGDWSSNRITIYSVSP